MSVISHYWIPRYVYRYLQVSMYSSNNPANSYLATTETTYLPMSYITLPAKLKPS